MLSYFRYWGEGVCEMLEMFSAIDQRRILHHFMNIIEGGLYESNDGDVVIKANVPRDLELPLKTFIQLYLLDDLAEKAVEAGKTILRMHLNH